jgi:DNA-binding LacI/PurR family transcriptional regulator
MGRYLLHSGHRRIAYVMGQPSSRWTMNRLQGLRQAFAMTGDPHAVQVVPYGIPDLSIDHDANFRAVFSVTAARGVNKDHLHAFMSAIRRMEDPLQVETNNAVTSVRVAEACRAVVRESGVTAWVGENDVVAIACLDAIAASRSKVVRVVGFDDSRAATERSLTSYNFGMDRLVRAMVGAIVDPAPMRGGRRTEPVEIEGTVVVR